MIQSNEIQSLDDALKMNSSLVATKSIARRSTPLHIAAARNNVAAIKVLLSYNASVVSKAKNEETPYHLSANNRCIGAMRALIDHYPDGLNLVNGRKCSPLHLAVINDANKMVAFLLEHTSINVNLKDNAGKTAEKYASSIETREIFKGCHARKGKESNTLSKDDRKKIFNSVTMIITNNYAETLRDTIKQYPSLVFLKSASKQTTLLHIAATSNNPDMIEILLNHDDGYSQTTDGLTAYHYAANNMCIETMKALLEYLPHGVVNLVTNKKQSPLHLAVIKGSPEIVELLLQNNSMDVTLRDIEDKTAKEYTFDKTILEIFSKHNI